MTDRVYTYLTRPLCRFPELFANLRLGVDAFGAGNGGTMSWRAALAVLAVATALLPVSGSAGCLTNSAHDMNPVLEGGRARVSQRESDICSFCHTPTRQENGSPRPGWEHRAVAEEIAPLDLIALLPSALNTFPGEAGTFICLTCHDGTQALDVSPGLYGDLAGAGAHPVGVPYAGAPALQHPVADRDPSRREYTQPSAAVINSRRVWWIDTSDVKVAGVGHQGESSTREKSDLMLFTRGDKLEPEPLPYVECASCHDPHQCETESFLRIDNERSALCVACHSGI